MRLRKGRPIAVGAFAVIREHVGHLRGFVVIRREKGVRQPLLTKAGFLEYIFLKSQLARKFFEKRGTDAKFVFAQGQSCQ